MPSMDIGYSLNRASRRLRLDLAARLAPLGLRPQQGAAIIALGRAEHGHLTPKELASAIDVDAPTATGLIERLERDGWIVVGPNPADGRSRLAALSPRGSEVLPVVLDAAHATSTDATRRFSPEERRTLSRLLARLCADEADVSNGASR